MWRVLTAAILGTGCQTTVMTVDNQSTRSLHEVHYWDHGDPCSNHLESPLAPGEQARVRVGPWDEPGNVYRLYGAIDEHGLCWSLLAGRVQDAPFTFAITDEDFDTWPCHCEAQ